MSGYKTSVIKACDFTNEKENPTYKTVYYYFAIAFENGESGSIGTKYRYPDKLKIGTEVHYILDEKTKKVKLANPQYDKPHPDNKQAAKPHVNMPHVQNKGEESNPNTPIQKSVKSAEQYLGFSLSYAKDITCARIAAQALVKPTTAKTKAKEIDFEADTIKLGKAFYKAIKEMLNEQ